MKNILELKNVSLTYHTLKDEILAVKDLSLTIKEGEFASIIGPSGCGKTTILSMIANLITPTSGDILIYGEKIKAENLGYMLQKDQLFPWRTIEKNIFLPLEIKGKKKEQNTQYSLDLLKKYGLFEFRKNYPDQLSGGMRQRAALIRTLSFKPDILLLDEPFSALDSQTRLSVSDDVYKILREENKTAVLVTHDISEAIAISDVIIVLTSRPATLKAIIRPNLVGSCPIEKRKDKNFALFFDRIWKELHS